MTAAEDPLAGLAATASQHPLVTLALELEAVLGVEPPIGEATDPTAERIRFRAHPGLGFPDREVRSLERCDGPGPVVVFQSLIGLHGPSSPLPPYFTERVIADDGEHGALAGFLDFFNHRLVTLLVRGYRQRRHHLRYLRGGRDALSRRALALAGVSPEEERVGGVGAPLLLSVLGLLALPERSAAALGAIVTAVTGLPAAVEEFVPRVVEIAEEDRARLGVAGSRLGLDMVIGDRIPDRLGAFRVVVGPARRADLDALLPGEPMRRTLDEIVAFAVRAPLARSLAVVLAPGEAPPWRLGEGRLGWTTWLDPDVSADNVVVL